ncbi:RsiV family protein [Nocardia sp. NPDC059091]|uniref:RsiV family protein n=1 Tax=unclassified Nocardia TaxID=2637762 RepID=UPI00367CD416
MRLKSAIVIAVCALALGLAACEAQHASTGPGGVGTPASTVEPAADQQRGHGRFVATTEHLTSSGKGSVGFDIDVPQVRVEGTGVNWSAGREFNDAMVQGMWTYVDQHQDPAMITDPNKSSTVERIGTHALSGVLYLRVDFHGAHPEDRLFSHVTNIDTAQEITLASLFTNEQQGLNVLAAQTKTQLARTRVADVVRFDDVKAAAATFQVWTATQAGLHVYFPQGQIGPEAAGVVDVTVPWSDLNGVLKPGMLAVLSS